jgi:hypothetical protein
MTSDPAEEPHDDPVARKNRRKLLGFIGVTLAVFGGVFAAIIYSDAAPPDLSDLAFTPLSLPDEENFYVQFVATSQRVLPKPLIDEDEVDESAAETEPHFSKRPLLKERLLEGKGWTPDRLAKYGPDLELIASAASALADLQHAQGRIPDSFTETARTLEIRSLWQHLQLATWALYRSGRRAEAVDLALLGARMGRTLRDARGTLIDYLTGVSMLSSFQSTLHDLAAEPDISADLLSRLLLGSLVADEFPDAYEHTLRNEFRLTKDALAKHNAEEAQNGYTSNDWIEGVAKTRVLFPLVYKPNLTIAILADLTRGEIAAVREDTAYKWDSMRRPPFPEDADSGAKVLLRPVNAHGREIAAMVAPSVRQLPRARYNAHSRRSLLQAYLALRIHHLETGTLPATLDELVPALLPALPRDFADGAPIRYSREARAIWSVGTDSKEPLIVTTADQEISPREIFHRLDFAAPPAPPPSAPATE